MLEKYIEAKVIKGQRCKRMSKGSENPWEVRCVQTYNGYYGRWEVFKTEQLAMEYIEDNPELLAPVIIYVNIPPMPY